RIRRSESFFPRGFARNTIRNLPPHEEEIRLVAKQEGRVRSLVDKWEKKGETPASVDWRKQGALTPVRDQKYCAAQYAFAFAAMLEAQFFIRHGELPSLSVQQLRPSLIFVAAMLEAQFFIRHGELPSLSVQQLIDCHNPENAVNYGCQGGHAMSTFYYLQIAGGLQSERDYPFEGKQGACRYVLGRDVVQVNDIFGLSGEKAMRHFIHRKGPVVAYQ
ncbi:cathepsin R-like, partial [Diaphorina citri]|uniref:Cathepsin R-like n=1 Tax=Diaphorina citri TaxID=121845 RepID=A0A1S3DB05_DIACI